MCVRACVCLIIAVRWMEEEEEEEGGGNCAVDVGRIEQQGASSVTEAVN